MSRLHERDEEARDMADLGPDYTKPDLAGVPLVVTRTCHYRVCPECEGSGTVGFYRTRYSNDPQDYDEATCPNCEDGEIVEWVDPLIKLRDVRRYARSVPWGALRYGELRQKAVSMVALPHDHQVCADCNGSGCVPAPESNVHPVFQTLLAPFAPKDEAA